MQEISDAIGQSSLVALSAEEEEELSRELAEIVKIGNEEREDMDRQSEMPASRTQNGLSVTGLGKVVQERNDASLQEQEKENIRTLAKKEMCV